MAASLLIMVCGITSRSKKHLGDVPELTILKSKLQTLRDELISLSAEDAAAYDNVLVAARELRSRGGDEANHDYQMALMHASDVPLRTCGKCLSVLEHATRVGEIGSVSAASDTGVAILLSEAGIKGAAMNVDINLKELADASYSKTARENLEAIDRIAKGLVKKGLSTLRRPSV